MMGTDDRGEGCGYGIRRGGVMSEALTTEYQLEP